MATRSVPERVNVLEEAVSALQHLPQDLAAFRAEVNVRFDQVDARFDQVDARFERVDSRFDRIDTQFQRIDEQFERIDARFQRIDDQFEQMYSQMRMLHEDLIGRIKALGEERHAGTTTPPRSPRSKRKR